MARVTLSPRFQIVIPKSIRDKLELKAGQKLHLIPYPNRIELIPEKDIKEMRGFLRGLDTEVPRERG